MRKGKEGWRRRSSVKEGKDTRKERDKEGIGKKDANEGRQGKEERRDVRKGWKEEGRWDEGERRGKKRM